MPKATHTPRYSVRLGEPTKTDLAVIAAHHAETTGTACSTSDAIRLAARREADRIRAEKKLKK